MENDQLTDKQQEVYDFIVKCVEENGYQPSLQEIGDHFGVDKNAIFMRVKGLAEKGWVRQSKPKKDRALTLLRVRFTSKPDSGVWKHTMTKETHLTLPERHAH